MATAKKLPSGNYRVRVVDYIDENKKVHRRSFTAPTKKQAEMMAAEYALGKRIKAGRKTFGTAIDEYVEAKEAVLSPATIREYKALAKNGYNDLRNIDLQKLTEIDIQRWVNKYSSTHAPSTTQFAYSLLRVVLRDNRMAHLIEYITLPKKRKEEFYVPSTEDVKRLLDMTKGTYMESAILLGAYVPMRRGEIAALNVSDIDGDTLHINKTMVKGPDGSWHIKQPKTLASNRNVVLPKSIINALIRNSKNGHVCPGNPNTISQNFRKIADDAGLENVHFHSLRHFGASILHYWGIPDQAVISRGGWSSDRVMKQVYRGEIESEKKKQDAIINQKINSVLDI